MASARYMTIGSVAQSAQRRVACAAAAVVTVSSITGRSWLERADAT